LKTRGPLIRSFGKFLLPIAKFIQLLTPKSFAQSLYVVLKERVIMISVVIPAYNEEDSILLTIERIQQVFRDIAD